MTRTVEVHPRLQIPVDEPFQPLVLHLPAKAGHENVMIHLVKELLQVHVHHPLLAFLLELEGLPHGVMRPASGPETKTRPGESGIE